MHASGELLPKKSVGAALTLVARGNVSNGRNKSSVYIGNPSWGIWLNAEVTSMNQVLNRRDFAFIQVRCMGFNFGSGSQDRQNSLLLWYFGRLL